MKSRPPTSTSQRTGWQQALTSRSPIFVALVGLLLLLQAPASTAQNVPVISGGLGFLHNTNAGAHSFQPVVTPQFTSPLGSHLLVESRFYFGENINRKNGPTKPYDTTFFKFTQYLQLDYIANPHLTLVAGRFLTPFGTYNERLSPIWIQNIQSAPRITSIGDPDGSSDGLMVRGVVFSKPSVQMNYIGFFSVPVSNSQFLSARQAGDRIDFYFPRQRLEIGTSYDRTLQGNPHTNAVGTHVWWQPYRFPLQVRSEYAHGPHSQGYWVESTYRLSQWRGPESVIGRVEPVFRMQQTFRDSPGSDGLANVNLQQADFGLVYHFPHETRIATSYSRKFASNGNTNIWSATLTYRFLFPIWRGRK